MEREEIVLKRYDAYKDSGVEWLGEIPSHWEVKRLKDVCSINLNTLPENCNNNFEFKYVDIGSVTLESGINHTEDFIFKNAPSRARRIAKEGDTVISTVRTYLKAIDFIDNIKASYIYSTGFAVLQPKVFIYPVFLAYFVRSDAFTDQVTVNSKGMSYPAINSTDLSILSIVHSGFEEQTAIASFLDRKTALIDQAITIKQQQIELLKERRQILIHRAVTRGLNPNVKMKDSGVEWIGEIPEGWEVKRLRVIGKTQNGLSKGGEYFGTGFPFLTYGDVYKGIELPNTLSGLAESTDEDQKQFSVQEGDVFFTRTSETVDEIGFASTCMNTIEKATFAGFLIRFRPDSNILYKGFSKFYFSSSTHRTFFIGEMNLVIRASLSQELLKRMPVVIPPMEEQIEISEYIENATTKIATAISLKEQEIEGLKEYKATLINGAVTGKVKVG